MDSMSQTKWVCRHLWVSLFFVTRWTQHPDEGQGRGNLTPLDLRIPLLGMQAYLPELLLHLWHIMLEVDMMLVAK